MSAVPDDRYLTIQALAEYRCESPKSARRFVERSRIPIYRDFSGRVRVLKSEVDEAMQQLRIAQEERPVDLKSMLDSISQKVLEKRLRQ